MTSRPESPRRTPREAPPRLTRHLLAASSLAFTVRCPSAGNSRVDAECRGQKRYQNTAIGTRGDDSTDRLARCDFLLVFYSNCGSVAEWLASWTRSRAWVKIAAATLSGNSLRQTVHTHRATVHQAAKLVSALFRVAKVTVGLAESNGSLPQGL